MSDAEHNQWEDPVTIAYFSNYVEAGIACELLVNNGINASLTGANFSGLEPLSLPGGYSEIRLVVPALESAAARELYEAFFSGDEERLEKDQEISDE